MHQPKSLQELARAKVSQAQLNEALLKTIKQTVWQVVKDNNIQYQQNLQSIESLLDAAADPNYCDPEKNLPLIYYAGECIKPSGLREWQSVLDPENYRYETIKILLSHGANPDLLTPKMAKPFIWAALKDIHIVRLLLEYRANPNILNSINETLLIYSAAYTSGEPVELAMLLLSHGADAQLTNSDNETALAAARRFKNLKLISLLEDLEIKKLA